MIPRSALNIILIVLSFGLVRYCFWFYFDSKVEELELWSVLGVGVTFGILYQLVSDATKSWFSGIIQHVLSSSLTTKVSIATATTAALILLLVSYVDISWKSSQNIELFVNEKSVDTKLTPNQNNSYTIRRYALSFSTRTIRVNVFSEKINLSPLTRHKISIPTYSIMKENRDIQEIEKQLLMAFLQFFEARYLDEAKKQIGALKNASQEQGDMLPRLDSVRQLIELTIVGPDVAGTSTTLLERFEAIYSEDPWLPLLKAAYHYGRKEYRDGCEALSSFEEKSKYPKLSTALFFRGVMTLRIARELPDKEKNKTIDEAISLFREAANELESEPLGTYRNIALSSALYFQGVAEFYRRNLMAARKHFGETAKVAEGDILARAWNGFGYISFILGELQEAELALLKSLDSSPTFAYARSNYGYVLLAQNKLDQAISLFEQNTNDEKLKKESYRDVVLAKLAIVHAKELKKFDINHAINNYSLILNELKLRDFVGVDPPKLRLAFIYNEVGEKVYLDKNYYGLEIFALSYFAKSGLMAMNLITEYPNDKRVELIIDKSANNFINLQNIVDTSWFSNGGQAGLFSSIAEYKKKTAPNK